MCRYLLQSSTAGVRHSTPAVKAAETASGWQAGTPCAQQPGLRSGPVRTGKPSRPRSRSLFLFLFVLKVSICHRHRRTRNWCSSCSTALADKPLLPSLRKLSPCRFCTMFAPDELAARVPRILGDAEVSPSTFGLPVAVEEIKLMN
jgi:hypothetical protein